MERCLECCDGPSSCNCACHVGQSTPPASNALAVEDKQADIESAISVLQQRMEKVQPADIFGNDLRATDSFGTTRPPMDDPWKAVQRIKLHHELVVHAAVTMINCAEWQGEGQAKFLAEAIVELKTALGKLRYLHPREADHD